MISLVALSNPWLFLFYLWIYIQWLLLFSHSVVSDSLRPMDCSTPGFPVLHHLQVLAQTHVR